MFPLSVTKTIPVSLAEGVSVSEVSALIADKLKVFKADVYRDEYGDIRFKPKRGWGIVGYRWNGLDWLGPGAISFHEDGSLLGVRYECKFQGYLIREAIILAAIIGAALFQKMETWWVFPLAWIPMVLLTRFLTVAWFDWFLRKTLKGGDPFTMCGIKYW